MTHYDNRPGPGRNYRETAVFALGWKVVSWPKKFPLNKNTQNLLKDWYLFEKMVLFCLHNFSRSWFELRNVFLGEGASKTWILAQISVFCYRTSNFVNGLFVALGETFHFRVTAIFIKKTWLKRQKVFPHPTAGAPSASNSPSALSARAG